MFFIILYCLFSGLFLCWGRVTCVIERLAGDIPPPGHRGSVMDPDCHASLY